MVSNGLTLNGKAQEIAEKLQIEDLKHQMVGLTNGSIIILLREYLSVGNLVILVA